MRNHDMHAIVDMRSGKTINRPPGDIIVERHVWIGQNALVLNCPRIGVGSIIGAQSLAKTGIGEFLAVGGVPARVLRTEVSWGRDSAGISQAELDSISSLPLYDELITPR
jgi:acetyltransferase-like isoleucine patch superfamily enzyme